MKTCSPSSSHQLEDNNLDLPYLPNTSHGVVPTAQQLKLSDPTANVDFLHSSSHSNSHHGNQIVNSNLHASV